MKGPPKVAVIQKEVIDLRCSNAWSRAILKQWCFKSCSLNEPIAGERKI